MSSSDFNIGVVKSSKTFHQLGVLVIDGSGSMSDECAGNITKAQAVNLAVREMFSKFKSSRYRANFSFAVVTFDQKASTHTDITPAETIDDNASYDPLVGNGGGTKIGAGLITAQGIAEAFLGQEPEGGVPSSVVILVMSDGNCGEPDKTKVIADGIKQNNNISICTTLFARVGEQNLAPAQQLLQSIASDPVMGFKTVYDGATLRDFFIRSASSGTAGNVRIE